MKCPYCGTITVKGGDSRPADDFARNTTMKESAFLARAALPPMK